MPPEKSRNQFESTLEQVMKDITKLEQRADKGDERVDRIDTKINGVNVKATLALAFQVLQVSGVVFIITKLFDIASKIPR